MRFQTELLPGVLIKRYKRFFADCRLANGQEVTAHIANTGPMTGLVTPGTKVWLAHTDDPKRKLKYSWKLAEMPDGTLVGVDTGAANRIVEEGLRAGVLPDLVDATVRREVKYGTGSRVDFLCSFEEAPALYLEVKSVTLSRNDRLAEFPDTVTERGAKHMAELAGVLQEGHRAAVLYLVQRTDCHSFAIADDIDPGYAAAATVAKAAGLETWAFDTKISLFEITMQAAIPFAAPDTLASVRQVT